jgi:class 3 adenylate cyclase
MKRREFLGEKVPPIVFAQRQGHPLYIGLLYVFSLVLIVLPILLISSLLVSLTAWIELSGSIAFPVLSVGGVLVLTYLPYYFHSRTIHRFLGALIAGDLPDQELATATWKETIVYPQKMVVWTAVVSLVLYAILGVSSSPRFGVLLSFFGNVVGFAGIFALTQALFLFYIEWAMNPIARLALAAGAKPELDNLKAARLRTKLLLIFFLIITLPVTALGLFGYGQIAALGGDPANSLRVAVVVAFASGGIAVFLAFLLIRSVSKPLQEIQRVADEVSRGNLDISVRPLAADEISEMGLYFNRMVQELQQQEHLKAAFGRYVSPAVRDGILGGEIALGGERREMTIMFTDIRDFTMWCEETPPETVIRTLNSYYENLIQALIKHGGTLTRFTGDGVLALFGAPLDDSNHALNAVRAACEASELLEKFNAIRRSVGAFELHTGFGIHTGIAVVGSIGCEMRAEYTPIGDAANVASRIEGLNRELGTVILISEATYQRVLPGIVAGKRAETQVKGRSKPVQVVEVIGLNGALREK